MHLSTEILGPSFFIKVAKKHGIGLTVAARASGNVRNITGNLGQNAFDYFLNSSSWNTAFQDQSARVNAMAWLEYGLHYATVIADRGGNEIKGGVSPSFILRRMRTKGKTTISTDLGSLCSIWERSTSTAIPVPTICQPRLPFSTTGMRPALPTTSRWTRR